MCLHLRTATSQTKSLWIIEKNEMWFLSFSELLPVKASAVAAKLLNAVFAAQSGAGMGAWNSPTWLSCHQCRVWFGLVLWLENPKLLAGSNRLITSYTAQSHECWCCCLILVFLGRGNPGYLHLISQNALGFFQQLESYRINIFP